MKIFLPIYNDYEARLFITDLRSNKTWPTFFDLPTGLKVSPKVSIREFGQPHVWGTPEVSTMSDFTAKINLDTSLANGKKPIVIFKTPGIRVSRPQSPSRGIVVNAHPEADASGARRKSDTTDQVFEKDSNHLMTDMLKSQKTPTLSINSEQVSRGLSKRGSIDEHFAIKNQLGISKLSDLVEGDKQLKNFPTFFSGVQKNLKIPNHNVSVSSMGESSKRAPQKHNTIDENGEQKYSPRRNIIQQVNQFFCPADLTRNQNSGKDPSSLRDSQKVHSRNNLSMTENCSVDFTPWSNDSRIGNAQMFNVHSEKHSHFHKRNSGGSDPIDLAHPQRKKSILRKISESDDMNSCDEYRRCDNRFVPNFTINNCEVMNMIKNNNCPSNYHSLKTPSNQNKVNKFSLIQRLITST